MGARWFHEGRIEIVDYTTLLLEGRLPKSAQAPTCLDELVDWVQSANVLIKEMKDVVQVEFRPHISSESIMEEYRDRRSVNQQHVADFDLPSFCESNIVIVAETSPCLSTEGKYFKSVLSVADFCAYYTLLRRYTELMDVGRPAMSNGLSARPQCSICMSNGEDMVLPCSHSMCTSCAGKWVSVKGNCPFCRHRYNDVRRMEKDQWQLEQWSQDSLENDICNLESKLKSFWCKRGTFKSITREEWLPLDSSFSTTLIVPIDFVHLK